MAEFDKRCRASAIPSFLRAMRSEWMRLRRSPIVALHAIVAAALGLAAGLYFATTPWDAFLGFDAFVQLVGAGAPLLAGISCGLSIDAEREAGEYANLLGQPSRRCACAAKGVVLLSMGALACLCTIALFSLALALAGRPLPAPHAIAASLAGAIAGSAALYALFIAVALKWGRNASIGAGALGFMCALASLGGLGNGLVTGTLSAQIAPLLLMAVPFTWPARLSSLGVEVFIAKSGVLPDSREALDALIVNAQVSIGLCLAGSIIVVVALLACANRFEDTRRTKE